MPNSNSLTVLSITPQAGELNVELNIKDKPTNPDPYLKLF